MAGKVTAGLVESNSSLPLGFMTMHAGTCRLTAEYRISSILQHSTYENGTYLVQQYQGLTRPSLTVQLSESHKCSLFNTFLTLNFI